MSSTALNTKDHNTDGNSEETSPGNIRTDLRRIQDWIEPGSRLLDLACGDGTLLALLAKTKNTTGYGMEISQPDIQTCLEKGLNVIHRDIELGLKVFEDRSFDYVLTTHSIQTLRYPAHTLLEMVRVGVRGIVSFPNMGFWSNRLSIGLLGKMPRTRSLPHEWHDTPNTHLCTLRDFENLCEELDINILRRAAVSNTHDKSLGSTVLPNLFSETALYEITAK